MVLTELTVLRVMMRDYGGADFSICHACLASACLFFAFAATTRMKRVVLFGATQSTTTLQLRKVSHYKTKYNNHHFYYY